MYLNCMPDIMILNSNGSPNIFVHKVALLKKMPMLEKRDNSVKYLQNLPKVNQVIYTLDTIYALNIMIRAQGFLRYFVHNFSMG